MRAGEIGPATERLLRAIDTDDPVWLSEIGGYEYATPIVGLVRRGCAVRVRSNPCQLQITAAGRATIQAIDARRQREAERVAEVVRRLKPIIDIVHQAMIPFPAVSLADVLGRTRPNAIVAARRAVIVAIATARPSWPQSEIARRLGIDHTTILHALRRHLDAGYLKRGRQWHGDGARAIVAAQATTATSDAPTQAP